MIFCRVQREKYYFFGMHRMRIAIFLNRLQLNGIHRMRLNLAREFLKIGHELDFVVGQAVGEMRSQLPVEANLHVIASRGSFFFLPGLVRYLHTRKPDYILSAYEDINIMVIFVNRVLGRHSKVLVSTHNALWPLRIEGRWTHRFKNRLLLSLLGSAYRKADAVVAVSHGLAKELSEVTGISPSHIRVIYNPVISDRFDAQVNETLSSELEPFFIDPVIGFFGRLREQKNLEILVEAFGLLRLHGVRCKLLIVGEGEKKSVINELVVSSGLDGDVLFHDFVDNPFGLMRHCTVVALSSKYEGLPNVLTEAMACGTQVVSTDCPHGAAEILENGKWGQLVPVGDAPALADALQRTLTKRFWVAPELLRERGLEFSAEHAAHAYLGVLGASLPLTRK